MCLIPRLLIRQSDFEIMQSQIKFFLRKVDEFTEISSKVEAANDVYCITFNPHKSNTAVSIKTRNKYYRILLDGVEKVGWTQVCENDHLNSEECKETKPKTKAAIHNFHSNLDTSIEIQLRDSLTNNVICKVQLPKYTLKQFKDSRAKSLRKVLRLYLKRIRLFSLGKISNNYHLIEESRAILRTNHYDHGAKVSSFNRNNLRGSGDNVVSCGEQYLIILPVYNSLHTLRTCIQRLVRYTSNYQLLIIEDSSTDRGVRSYLESLDTIYPKAPISIQYNEENIGFVRTVNKGLSEALKQNISAVILNSDAFVADGNWLAKLMHPIQENPSKIASVTPLSNAATIMTVPFICCDQDVDEGEILILNKAASSLSPQYNHPIPSGIGYCMAMNIKFIRLIPHFDEVFGHGYGEEVDWCQKANQCGGINIGITNLFVAHVGAQSFGNKRKRKAIQNAQGILSERYPSYDAQVQQFIEKDLFSFARIIAGIKLQASRKLSTKLYIGHNGTGGAQNYLDREVKSNENHSIIVLRPCVRSCWLVQLVDNDRVTSCSIDDTPTLIEILKDTPDLEVIYSCGVGHPAPLEIPKLLISVRAAIDCKIKILYHDYFPITPSYNLLNKAHHYELSEIINGLGKTEWSKLWTECHRLAEEILVFSENTRSILKLVYPDVSGKTTVKPHNVNYIKNIKSAVRTNRRDDRLTIGVLGNINIAKGGLIIQALTKYYCRSTENARIVVIGEVDPTLKIKNPSIVHGKYEPDHINSLIDKYEIDMWLFPSVWPETFSYVMHECVATQLPVMCFNLGAQTDIIKKYVNGVTLNYDYTSISESTIPALADELLERYHQISTCDDQGRRNLMSEIA